jgi:hypothetical protein
MGKKLLIRIKEKKRIKAIKLIIIIIYLQRINTTIPNNNRLMQAQTINLLSKIRNQCNNHNLQQGIRPQILKTDNNRLNNNNLKFQLSVASIKEFCL